MISDNILMKLNNININLLFFQQLANKLYIINCTIILYTPESFRIKINVKFSFYLLNYTITNVHVYI